MATARSASLSVPNLQRISQARRRKSNFPVCEIEFSLGVSLDAVAPDDAGSPVLHLCELDVAGVTEPVLEGVPRARLRQSPDHDLVTPEEETSLYQETQP